MSTGRSFYHKYQPPETHIPLEKTAHLNDVPELEIYKNLPERPYDYCFDGWFQRWRENFRRSHSYFSEPLYYHQEKLRPNVSPDRLPLVKLFPLALIALGLLLALIHSL